jgi:anti-sigma regulatory factor (Ser/Thr protein kinase)
VEAGRGNSTPRDHWRKRAAGQRLRGQFPAQPRQQLVERELRIRLEAAELHRAREFAASAAQESGLGESGRYQFMLAASEAVTSSLDHGLPFADGCIALRTVNDGEMLSLLVSDCGSSTWDLVDPGFLRERGGGLGVVSLLMDEVELQPAADHTTVRMSKRLRR